MTVRTGAPCASRLEDVEGAALPAAGVGLVGGVSRVVVARDTTVPRSVILVRVAAIGVFISVEPAALSTMRRTTRPAPPDDVLPDGDVTDLALSDDGFPTVDLLDDDFSEAVCPAAVFPEIVLSEAVFPEAVFPEAVFPEAVLSEVDFTEDELPDTGFPDDDPDAASSEVDSLEVGPDDDFPDDVLSDLPLRESEWAGELTAPDGESPSPESPFPGAA